MNQDNLSEHEKIFYNDGFMLGQQAALNVKDEKKFFSYIEEMYQSIDKLIDSLLDFALKQGVTVDCKKGCSWCCHQAVFANSYEVHYLGEFIKKNFSSEEQENILKSAKQKNKKTSTLKEKDVLAYKSPCALLKDGACMAYEARPMACRIYLSMNLSSCTEFYKNPRNKNNYPALLEFPLQAGRMMNEGFIAALKEMEVYIDEFKLEDGLQRFLISGSNL